MGLSGRERLTLRPAVPDDRRALAELHAASMRRAYRGILPDQYLEVGLVAEREAAWTDRLERSDGATTLVAERAGELLGLAHVEFDADPTWGSLLESLHVALTVVRSGIGTALFGRVAEVVVAQAVGRGLHLWVYDANTDACRFYDRIGGRVTGSKVAEDGGGTTPSSRYWWRDAGEPARSL